MKQETINAKIDALGIVDALIQGYLTGLDRADDCSLMLKEIEKIQEKLYQQKSKLENKRP